MAAALLLALAAATFPGRAPHAAVDETGRVALVVVDDEGLAVRVSDDGGETFAAPLRVATDLRVGGGGGRGPKVGWAGDALVVTAIAGEELRGRDGDVLAWRVDPADGAVGDPVRLNAVEGAAREGLHDMDVAADGTLLCAWIDLAGEGARVAGARSTDGGLTWSDEFEVYRSPEGSICECCRPTVAGELVMWRNNLGGLRDMYLTGPDEDGAYRAASKLGHGGWEIDGCPMAAGGVAVSPAGEVRTVWRRKGTLFAARPAEPEEEFARGRETDVAFGPDGFVRAWTDNDGEVVWAPADGEPTVLGRGTDVHLAAGPDGRGPVVLAWQPRPDEAALSVLVPR